jgi:hypothetical protein
MSAVTRTIKMNIHTATMHIFSAYCGFLTFRKYIDIQRNNNAFPCFDMMYKDSCKFGANDEIVYVWRNVREKEQEDDGQCQIRDTPVE